MGMLWTEILSKSHMIRRRKEMLFFIVLQIHRMRESTTSICISRWSKWSLLRKKWDPRSMWKRSTMQYSRQSLKVSTIGNSKINPKSRYDCVRVEILQRWPLHQTCVVTAQGFHSFSWYYRRYGRGHQSSWKSRIASISQTLRQMPCSHGERSQGFQGTQTVRTINFERKSSS